MLRNYNFFTVQIILPLSSKKDEIVILAAFLVGSHVLKENKSPEFVSNTVILCMGKIRHQRNIFAVVKN